MMAELTEEQKQAILDSMCKTREKLQDSKDDANDKRCLRGKYAPETGTCRPCGGTVVGKVRFNRTGMIGGPPPPAYVHHWECNDCGLMYGKCPK